MVFAFIAVMLSPSDATERFSNGYTQHPQAAFKAGFWWDPEQPGSGLDLHMSGDTLVATWATYDETGRPTWYLGTGSQVGETWQVSLSRYNRAVDSQVQGELAGTLSIEFVDGRQANVSWAIGDDTGTQVLTAFSIDESPIAEDRTGFWYRPSSPGSGMSVVTQSDLTMLVYYFYDDAGQPTWIWADNVETPGTPELEAWQFRGSCPSCAPSASEVFSAGQFFIEFQSEDAARISVDLNSTDPQLAFDWIVQSGQFALLSNRASGRSEPFRLAPFTNAETLEAYLKQGIVDPGPYGYYYSPDIAFSPAPPEALSTTNVQEQGVDELDVVKSDGAFLYTVSGFSFPHGADLLRVFDIRKGAPELINEIALDMEIGVEGLYLRKANAEGERDILIAISSMQSYYAFDAWFSPFPWIHSDTTILAFDVTDPSQPEILLESVIEGGGVQSRLIDDTLYFVSRSLPDTEPFFNDEDGFEAALQRAPLAQLLPEITINGVSAPLVNPQDTLLPPQPPGYRYTDLITVSAFDLNQLGELPATVGFVGLAETVYVSLNNLFIASSRYSTSLDPGFDALTHFGELFTDIHQFSLANGKPEYAGSGSVEGFLTWGGISPSFAFSESNSYLRVVTSSATAWPNTEHRLAVLNVADQEHENLRVRAVAPSRFSDRRLGKPGELLYGLRFLSDRLYAVTFKKTDPLYVVDLEDPLDPRIKGELEITGYSEYLHPLADGLLLGFGLDAVPADNIGDGSFAWFQGLQVSLFDVEDPDSPSLSDQVLIGRRGSCSPLLLDHHAFTYLPPTSTRAERLVLPLVVSDAGTPQSDPTFYYPWKYTGFGLFEVDPTSASLNLIDLARIHSSDADPDYSSYADCTPAAARSVLVDENVYLYQNGWVYQLPWQSNAEIVGPY